jgi:mRNA interferase MazF
LSFDTTSGHEQAGFSPAVVLSPGCCNKASELCLVCPITTDIKGYPFEVVLEGAKTITGGVSSISSAPSYGRHGKQRLSTAFR